MLVSDPTLLYVKAGKARVVGLWLASVGATVLGMILVGGYTRLSRAGLSMTKWNPLGTLPPRDTKAWEEEFTHYKEFPEYQLKNKDLSLAEFKRIWYIEWAHRSIGRALAPIFGLPLLYFSIRGYLRKRLVVAGLGLFGIVILRQSPRGAFKDLLAGGWSRAGSLKSETSSIKLPESLPTVSPSTLASPMQSTECSFGMQ